MRHPKHRLLVPVTALLLAMPLAACEDDGGADPSVTTEERADEVDVFEDDTDDSQ